MASDMDKLDPEKLQVDSRLGTGPNRERLHDSPSLTQMRSLSIARVRSNNGHGCADLDDGDDSTDDTVTPDHPQVEKDPFEVTWESETDPLCPKSMSIVRKWLVVITVGMGSLCVTCTSSIYASTYSQMNPEFHISSIVGTLGLSLFVLGIALGPLLMSPLSEFVGRRPIYLISWALFLIWLIPSAVSRNAATMMVARFIDGFGGSSFLSVAGGTVSDIFNRDQIQAPMVIIALSPFVGPSLGPLLGGFINYYSSWRWTYYAMLIWSVVEFAMIIFFAPETYHPIKLREKARKLRKETGDERWKAPMEKSNKSVGATIGNSLLRPFQLLIFEPMCLLLCLFSAILLGVLYLFFGAFSLVFGGTYGFNLWQSGLSFLGIFTGMIICSAIDPIWRIKYLQLLEQNNGRPEPEFRLPSAIAGAFLVPIGLFIFAWTAYPWVHWIVPIIGSGIFGCGTLMVFTGIFTFLVDAYPLYAASALAANSFVRCTFAAAFPLFGIQMYQKLGYQWGSSLLAFLTVAMMPFPYLFFRYGKQIRKNSRFATHS
ncbi:putative bicyclomycin resistance protein [Annulohypoxylon maeteangense]|uniref:putative bicyclomycin resistance protein n=1 Tax=Annulohypoxylon maeteangense TaxID=1927788 RepID=UPI00200736F1|nr:putative bicyclomycin resistance protein [Annulohypoxylon maeteangense]KAI0884794.1 putative bicyclomycin resistance protein [Annulohypoxylon maeteangense]